MAGSPDRRRVGTGVSGGGEDRLPLGRGLLEQQVLCLLQTRLAELDVLLAQTPARADHLGGVGLDHRQVLVDRVVLDPVDPVARALVDVDRRVRRERRDILDVEQGLTAPRPGRLAAVDLDHVQPSDHRQRLRGAEIAAVERLDVRAQERLELVDVDRLAGAEIADVVQAEGAVRVGDLIVGQAAEALRGGRRRRARRRGAGPM
jgi:hypothetical protein